MARTKKKIDRPKLEQAIKQAEKDGPLKNRGELWVAAANIYNDMDVPETLTHSVVYLRVKEWKIEVKTPVGKRGRAAGPMSQATKDKMQTARQNRKSKAEKFENSDDAQVHFDDVSPMLWICHKGSKNLYKSEDLSDVVVPSLSDQRRGCGI